MKNIKRISIDLVVIILILIAVFTLFGLFMSFPVQFLCTLLGIGIGLVLMP